MADLLRSGNKMLNLACPVCNNPIFRNREGITFCPTCNRKVIFAEDKTNQDIDFTKSERDDNENQENLFTNRYNVILNHLENVIYQKIEKITVKLENETNSQVIETYNKILLDLINILNVISTLVSKK